MGKTNNEAEIQVPSNEITLIKQQAKLFLEKNVSKPLHAIYFLIKSKKMTPKKRTLLLLTLLLLLESCNPFTENSKAAKEYAKMEFDDDFYDFGKIPNGDTVYHIFKFVNTSAVPLKIENISASCGCTVAEWPKEEVDPRKAGEIKIQFSKAHDPGVHSQSVIVKANTSDPYTVLKFSATIEN